MLVNQRISAMLCIPQFTFFFFSCFGSVLPEDDWFAEVAQIAIKMLTGKANFSNVGQDVTSPTQSVSAKSVSSIYSHGSESNFAHHYRE